MSDRLGSRVNAACHGELHAVRYYTRSCAARSLWPLWGHPENHLDVGDMVLALADSLRDVGRE